MKKLLFILVLILSDSVCFGQQISEQKIKAKNAIFFELFGSGGIYSLNYERILENKFSVRSGLSYIHSDGFLIGRRLSIPLTSSYLISTDRDSHIELGVGNTVAFEDGDFKYGIGPLAGFREQDLVEGGGYFRITFTPLLSVNDNNTFFGFWAGLSFGASF